ncbi:MAG: squalene--hopene cyclase [Pirellulales bacterium]|nr:squalene--hopene cyclase [Pirellulales bacterium]
MRMGELRRAGLTWVVWLSAVGVVALGAVVSETPSAVAAEPVTLENVKAPEMNDADEPLAAEFSLDAAIGFLDAASVNWQKQRNCMTCHTNYLYLLARPAIGADAPAHGIVRQFAEKLVTERWPSQGPRWDAEVVMTGAMLALNDRATTGKLHPTTRTALDRAWTVQRDDGGFSWLKCDWPPMEDDDHFGATMAAIGVGAAPEGYAQSEAAQAGLAKLREYLRREPTPTLHHRLMMVWASLELAEIWNDQQRTAALDELWPLQHDDGGWAVAQLGPWQREDGTPQDTTTSDGYGTGFAVYIARRAGVPADNARLVRAIDWLKTHQRASGRWFTRSVHADNEHFISHAGTAYAILALAACDALPKQTAQASGPTAR